DYSGRAALEDTAAEVRALRKRGIRVVAVFYGLDSDLPAASRIYGSSLARIQDMDQLADVAGRIIRQEISRLEQDGQP
ncbi:MAG: hypothetical protein Q4C73_08675, partial [Eubacteriales bacterium]|nr:hypothetical protein [Eubacteriales bacterium]